MWGCLIYILYAALARAFNLVLLLALAAIFLEGIALILNKGRCPLTTLAEKWGAEKGSVTDIFLPPIIARNAFRVSAVIFIIELVFLANRYFTGQ
jgi:hypothetical protein